MRIDNHPILGEKTERAVVTFYFDGKPVEGLEGEPVAAALYAAGYKTLHYSHKKHQGRSIYCAIGRCNECRMIVNGCANVRTCMEPLVAGMIVETQVGNGKI